MYSFTGVTQALYYDSFCIFQQPGEKSLDVLHKFQALSIARCVLTDCSVPNALCDFIVMSHPLYGLMLNRFELL